MFGLLAYGKQGQAFLIPNSQTHNAPKNHTLRKKNFYGILVHSKALDIMKEV